MNFPDIDEVVHLKYQYYNRLTWHTFPGINRVKSRVGHESFQG
ncbi:hypothetical protein [Heminiphilus faecis]